MTTSFVPRPALADLRAYNLDAPAGLINLADNTNAAGPPPGAARGIRALDRGLDAYPTTFSRPLREAIASYVGVAPDEIMVGCGSSDVIDSAYRAYGHPGTRLAHVAPTFVMARTFGLTNGLDAVAVPLTPDGDADASALVAADAAVTYLCSPNNPTGACHSATAIERVLDGTRGLVLLDEAYAEYAGRSHAQGAPRHDRLLVLRTFSKAFGLAGLRIGYGVGNAGLIAELEKVRGPYKVSSVAEAVALGAVTSDLAWMREAAAETVQVREAFIDALRRAGLAPMRSDANFVLVPLRDARQAADGLAAQGFLVRAFPGLPGTGDALRITIGPRDVMRRLAGILPGVL